jgi:hypothetical protein
MLIVLTALAMLRWEVPPSVCYGRVRSSDWQFKSTGGDDGCWDTSGVLVLLARTSQREERPERLVVLFFGFAEHLRSAIEAQLQRARAVDRNDESPNRDTSDEDADAALWSEWLETYAPRTNPEPEHDEPDAEPVDATSESTDTDTESSTTHTHEHEHERDHENTSNSDTVDNKLDDAVVVALGFKCEAGASAVLALTHSPYNFEFPLNSRSMMHVEEAAARPAHTMSADLFIAIVRMALDGFAYIHGFFQDALFQQTLQPTLIVQQQ